jgi:hypothetical protein
MIPNEKQIRACAFISSQLEFWAISDDMNSPSRAMEFSVNLKNGVLYNEFTETEAEEIEVKLIELLQFIRSLNVDMKNETIKNQP